jgi:hypothetical protein
MAPPTLPPPTPAAVPPARRARHGPSPERRAIQVGVAGTLFVHALLLWLVPQIRFSSDHPGTAAPGGATEAAFEVQFLPAAPANATPAPPAPEPLKFVEINPAAPDNPPDQTNLTGAQNQQAAQKIPTPDGRSQTPLVKGDPEKNSTAIVTGQLAQPRPLPVVPEPPAPPEEQRVARREQNPLPGDETFEGAAPDGLRGGLAPPAPNAGARERIEGRPDATRDNGFTFGLPVEVNPLQPRPRPTLPAATTAQARSTPLRDNPFGTSRVGVTAYDAKWSAYGDYLQRFYEIVEIQWHRLMGPSFVPPSPGTQVHVRFRLTASGEITEILSVSGNAKLDVRSVCVGAITDRAPYGPWPADMVAVLGAAQDLTFSFYYE